MVLIVATSLIHEMTVNDGYVDKSHTCVFVMTLMLNCSCILSQRSKMKREREFSVVSGEFLSRAILDMNVYKNE